jgi:sulfatase maturation enzyme AslB (radical SAM superfamily)
MIAYQDIRDVHFEISSLCNASCPWCPRNFWGYPYNSGYPEKNFTLENAKTVFSEDFLKQLVSININGNFGDIVMNPEGPDIVEYFFSVNPNLKVTVSTNGGARDYQFWTRLAQTPATILFCLDGLADTHHLYRQNTSYKTVIKNANTVIRNGGHAVWKMIQFDHNRHQIEQCRELSKQLGFKNFLLVDDGRDTAPVFNTQGKLTHVLGNYTGETNFEILFYKKKNDQVLLEDIIGDRTPATTISCEAKTRKSIFIGSTGDVSPCCFTGYHPTTYGHGQYHQAANAQLVPLIKNNNALKYSLKECIEWFNLVETSWNIPTFEQGRLVICNDVCGQN